VAVFPVRSRKQMTPMHHTQKNQKSRRGKKKEEEEMQVFIRNTNP